MSAETRPTRSRGKAHANDTAGLPRLINWMASRDWRPLPFQREVWRRYGRGESGLVNVATGAGKTYAAYFGPLAEMIDDADAGALAGIRLLWITPLRAVSRDIEAALRAPIDALDLRLRVESRTGDTSSSVKARQRRDLPHVLITTPESLTLLLTHRDVEARLRGLRAVVIDEWHELLSTKRGTQTELALARLRALCPALRTWALSATLANVDEAAAVAVGVGADASIVRARTRRRVIVDSLVPPDIDGFPWAGHLGLRMLDAVVRWLDPAKSTLLFTNTRSQAERWFAALRDALPDHVDGIALHHGSLDRDARRDVEDGLKTGRLWLAVSTSSLDLGVDFSPVERVVQVGSPKGIARLVQRAGRSGHAPGRACRIRFVPTHALELLEAAAARRALAEGRIEPRTPLRAPLDVLVQHLGTRALGGGFTEDELLAEVRTTVAYRDISAGTFRFALDLVTHGGETLRAYAQYHKVARGDDGRYRMADRRLASIHRLNIGTITADATVDVRFQRGKSLGSVEESFLGRLKPGDTFTFGGRTLAFVRMKDSVAHVRSASGAGTHTPKWMGGNLPLSTELADAVRGLIDACRADERPTDVEVRALAPLLDRQRRVSRIPALNEVLIETAITRDGHHLFVFPFEGRAVHEALASLFALRLGRDEPATFALSFNDYGFELVSAAPHAYRAVLDGSVMTERDLGADIEKSVNASEVARRKFREIARVSGLTPQAYPGRRKGARQLQASAGLVYDVFRKHDPQNLLLRQATQELLDTRFERTRLVRALARMRDADCVHVATERPSPFAFPLLVDRIAARVSSETLAARIERMKRQWAS